MKKALVALLAIAMVASLSFAQDEVKSVNVVGFVKLSLSPGFSMIRNDFINMEGDPTPENILGERVPLNTRIFEWDTGTGLYKIAEYKARTVIVPPNPPVTVTNWGGDDVMLDQGVGFWIDIPDEADDPTEISIMGEVPDNGSNTVVTLSGFNLISYPYPTPIAWTNTTLAKNPTIGDAVYQYNVDTGLYNISEYKVTTVIVPPNPPVTVTNWSGSDITIDVGEGFWYKKASAGSDFWEELQPYTL